MPEPEYIKVMIIFIIDEIFISKCERKNIVETAAWIFIRDADPNIAALWMDRRCSHVQLIKFETNAKRMHLMGVRRQAASHVPGEVKRHNVLAPAVNEAAIQ